MGISTADVQAWMSDYADVIAEHREELVALDTAIGDGDHGTNMNRGMQAVVERLGGGGFDDIGALLKAVGMTLVSKVGGAAGPLYGTLFLQMGTALNGKAEAGLDEWADALEAGVAGVQKRGRAEPGDKTMVDALLPAVQALRDAQSDGASLADALARSEEAAREGMLATTPMEARKGRASYLGPRSVGHQDPGATSSHLLLQTARARLS
ncbi:MAG TPA: dihydroxyacetone kinase subunit DhaL [Solirubrobacter sp.]|nr:dihydroxyacetone kinase subunit DhaL [Solirubrobacter sp.]